MTGLNWDEDGAQEGLMSRRSSLVCLSATEIEEFVFDRLSGVTREVVEDHLLVCHACLDKVEEEERYIATFREAGRRIDIDELESQYATAGGQAPAGRLGLLSRLSSWWPFPSGLTLKPALGVAALAVAVAIIVPRMAVDSAPVDVALHMDRGSVEPAKTLSPASRLVRFGIDLTELESVPEYVIQLVDYKGAILQSAQLAPQSGRLSWSTRSPVAGQYWVRILRPGAPPELLREFSLVVR